MNKPALTDRQKMLNRINRKLTLIEENAKRATPGPWSISHSHVIKHDSKSSYDIACRPWMKEQTVYEVYPYASPSASDDMRYIATCEPKSMLELVADVRTVLAELSQ